MCEYDDSTLHCMEGCISCTDSSTCTECAGGYNLASNMCEMDMTCAVGEFMNANVCESCMADCMVCTDFN